jgi:hypothetical protein
MARFAWKGQIGDSVTASIEPDDTIVAPLIFADVLC